MWVRFQLQSHENCAVTRISLNWLHFEIDLVLLFNKVSRSAKQWKPSQIRKDSEFFGRSSMVKLNQNDGSINATHFLRYQSYLIHADTVSKPFFWFVTPCHSEVVIRLRRYSLV